MEIQIKNPGMPSFRVSRPTKTNGIRASFQASKIVDKFQAREGKITLPREIPAKQFAEVLITMSGKPVFRGYIDQYEIDNKRTKTLSLQGMEKLLEYRYLPDFYYPDTTHFNDLFSDTCTLNKPPGLLAVANGMLPTGLSYTFDDSDKNIILIPGAGSNSRLSSSQLYYIDYKYIRELVSVHSLSELDYIDLSFFRNSENLYIRIDHDYSRGWADRGGVICDSAFDTTIRLGTCPTSHLLGELQTIALDENVADTITDLVLSHGYYMHWRDTSKILYLDIDSVEGRTEHGTI